MKRLIRSSEDIFAMANLRGKQIRVPYSLPFSFYFSERNSSYGIRVKPVFNPDRMHIEDAGNLELHGSWKFTPGRNDANVSSKSKKMMMDFFKTYKVLFAAVWEGEIQEDVVQDYFRGLISWDDMMSEFDCYTTYESEMMNISDVESLERFVRDNNIFNMND